MATFDYRGRTYTIVYVDPTIGVAGDGTTPALALDDLPSLASMSNNECYLIRRTGDANGCTVKHGETTSNKNLLFLGMPKSDDWMYDLMPTEAKTAWDADADDYGVWHQVASGNMQFTGAWEMLMLKNMKILNQGQYTGAYFYCQNNTWDRIDNEVHVDNILHTSAVEGRISSLTSDVAVNNYAGYIHIYNCGVVRVANSKFDLAANQAIYWQDYGTEFHFVNNEVWHLSGGDRLLYLRNYQSHMRFVTIKNITIHHYINGTQTNSYVVPGGPYFEEAPYKCEIDNIKVDQDAAVLGTTPSSWQMREWNWRVHAGDMVCTNLDLDYSKCWRIQTDATDREMLMIHGGSTDVNRGDNVARFENWNIRLTASGGIGTPNSKAEANPSSYRHLVFISSTENRGVAENLTIYAPRGRALKFNYCTGNNLTVDGSIWTEYSTANYNHIGSYWVSDVLYALNRARLYIEEIVMNKNNLDDPFIGDSAILSDTFDGVYVVCNNTNVPLFESIIGTGGDIATYTNMISFNDVSAGNWRMRSHRHLIETWNVTRDGNPVLKATCIQDDPDYPLIIGREPSRGFLVTPPSTGAKTAKIHVAHKNYVTMSKLMREMKVVMKVPRSADVDDTTYDYYDTQINGIWKDDAVSVYANDSGLTAWVCEIPINVVTVAKDVEFEFHWSHYSATGYFYIDPAPVIA